MHVAPIAAEASEHDLHANSPREFTRIVFPGSGRIALVRGRLGAIRPNAVLIRAEQSLISNGTERTVFGRHFAAQSHWDRWVKYPFFPGYAMVGTIVQTAENSARHVGERVAIRTPHCSHSVVDAGECILIPDGISFDDAVWFALAKIAFMGVLAASPRIGDSALVVGGGPVAQLAIRWLSRAGIQVAVVARDRVQLNLARSGGASTLLPGYTTEITRSTVKAALSERPCFVLDCTGTPEVLSWALDIVASHGKVVLVGDAGDPTQQRLTSDVLIRGVSILGAHDSHARGQWTDHTISALFFRHIQSGGIDLKNLCTHTFAPEEGHRAYRLIESREPGAIGVRFLWNTPERAAQER